MIKYHPYKSDKPGKKYYIITNVIMMIKRFILVKPLHLILQFIKMNNEGKDILIDTRKIKHGLNQA
jgi:hypothetical protein